MTCANNTISAGLLLLSLFVVSVFDFPAIILSLSSLCEEKEEEAVDDDVHVLI